MTHDEAVKFFDRLQEHWKARDPQGLARYYTEDATVVSPIFHTVKGHADILKSYQSLFRMFPDWDYKPEALLVDGSRVAEPFLVHATHVNEFLGMPGSNRQFDIQGVRVFQMKDGLIDFEQRYYDFTGLLIQLGVLRGKSVRLG
jgi:steroid delta-isomerase-like uncharacterized protein